MNELTSESRLVGLCETGLMDAPSSPILDLFARIASKSLGVPVAIVSLVDSSRQFFSSQVGLPEPWATTRQTPLSHSFCQHVVTSNAPLVVDDSRAHVVVKDNLAVRDLSVIAYAGVPIRLSTGEVLGSFCVIDVVPRQWSEADLSVLSDLADAVSHELDLRRRAHVGEVSERKLHELVATLEQSRSDRSSAVRKVQHDIRSPLSAIAMSAQLLLEHEAVSEYPEMGKALDLILENVERANGVARSFAKTS